MTLKLAAALLALVFAAVTAGVLVAGELPGDHWVLSTIHARVGSSIDGPMIVIGDLTDTLVLSLVAVTVAVVLWFRSRRQDAVWFLLAVVVVFAANPVLKEIVDRPRPHLRPPPESLSALTFPSGHASGTAALAGAFLILARGPRRAARVVVVLGTAVLGLVAFSRLALTAHYPSDIVAGWAWAGAWIALAAWAKHLSRGRRVGGLPGGR